MNVFQACSAFGFMLASGLGRVVRAGCRTANQPAWPATAARRAGLNRGKKQITLKLQASTGNFAGGLASVRILRLATP